MSEYCSISALYLDIRINEDTIFEFVQFYWLWKFEGMINA